MSKGATVSAPAAVRRGESCLAANIWREQVVERAFLALVQGVWQEAGGKKRRDFLAGGEAAAEWMRDGAIGWLERLLLLLYADARGRLPAGGGSMGRGAFGRLRAELAGIAGQRFEDVERRLSAAFAGDQAGLRDRVQGLIGPLERIFLSEPVSLPDDHLAVALDSLSRIWLDRAASPQKIDYRQRTTRDLGAAYERLLEFRLELDAPAAGRRGVSRFSLLNDKLRRKAGGCFYTPELIVEDIVEHTVGAALDAKLAALEAQRKRSPIEPAAHAWRDACFDFQVLDPSSGAGYFLDEARLAISRRIVDFLDRFPDRIALPRRRSAKIDVGVEIRPERAWAEREVAERCLFAIDVDPRAVELARMRLWLESPLEVSSLETICRNIRLGDALADPRLLNFPGAGEFDAVVGNPPYGGKLDAESRRSLARQLPLMKSNADTAAGFVQRAAEWVRPEGRVGLVVPKPLTNSYAWRGVRDFLRRRVERLIDVSRAWPEVRLEQAIVVFRGAPSTDDYRTGWISAGRIVAARPMSWRLADRFQTLPCALSPAELARLARLEFADATIGDVCRTFRGIPAQRQLAPCGETPVIGGRDLTRWRIRGASGYLRSPTEFELTAFAREKLVFQNIIAHAARPQPHVKLIGAYDERGTVTLDTVNNLAATDARVDLRGLCALLHSSLVNWLVYSLVYNKAIRTMHFDQYFLNKIPLPPRWPELLERLAGPALACEMAAGAPPESSSQKHSRRGTNRTAAELEDGKRQALEQIDRLVAAAYGDHRQS